MLENSLPSNRKFGWFFFLVFSLTTAYLLWRSAYYWVILTGIVSVTFLGLVLFAPATLTPLNRLWFKLGKLLSKIVSPVVLGILFYLLLTPVALLTRCFGRDELLIRKRKVNSYWIERTPVGPQPESFKNQF